MKILAAMSVYCILLLCVLFLTVYAASVRVNPSGETVAFEGGIATFTCEPTSFGNVDFRFQWLISGQPTEVLNLTTLSTASSNIGGGRGVLTWESILPEFNSSSIRCCVLDSNRNISSELASIVLQGTLNKVTSLMISNKDSHVVLNWMPPFTMDVTGIDPDISGYCVSVSIGNMSVCGIRETNYTFSLPSSTSPCDNFEFTVVAVNDVGLGSPQVIQLSETMEVPEVLNFVPIHDGRKVVRYHILLSVPVCTAEVFTTDLDTGEILRDFSATIVNNNEVTFSAEQLRAGRRYNVTIRASNIAGTSTSNVTINTAEEDDSEDSTVPLTSTIIIGVLVAVTGVAVTGVVIALLLWKKLLWKNYRKSKAKEAKSWSSPPRASATVVVKSSPDISLHEYQTDAATPTVKTVSADDPCHKWNSRSHTDTYQDTTGDTACGRRYAFQDHDDDTAGGDTAFSKLDRSAELRCY